MQKIAELTQPPIVGNTYLVPCIDFASTIGEGVPVMGDFHDDSEIGIDFCHIHPDYRFFNEEQYKDAIRTALRKNVWLYALAYQHDKPLVWLPKKCARQLLKYPIETLDGVLMRKLEQIHKNSKLNCGICPHKGANLNSIAPDAQGNRVCPLHNLMWNRDGGLVRRFQD